MSNAQFEQIINLLISLDDRYKKLDGRVERIENALVQNDSTHRDLDVVLTEAVPAAERFTNFQRPTPSTVSFSWANIGGRVVQIYERYKLDVTVQEVASLKKDLKDIEKNVKTVAVQLLVQEFKDNPSLSGTSWTKAVDIQERVKTRLVPMTRAFFPHGAFENKWATNAIIADRWSAAVARHNQSIYMVYTNLAASISSASTSSAPPLSFISVSFPPALASVDSASVSASALSAPVSGSHETSLLSFVSVSLPPPAPVSVPSVFVIDSSSSSSVTPTPVSSKSVTPSSSTITPTPATKKTSYQAVSASANDLVAEAVRKRKRHATQQI